MSKKAISRRNFLKAAATLAAAAAVQACAAPAPTAAPAATAAPTKPAAPAATAAPTKPAAPTYKEAPELAELVKAGKLPPVDQRLPSNPLVVDIGAGIGKYGGTLRHGFSGQADQTAVGQVLARGLLNINAKLAVVPDMAESWEVTPDAKEFTFHLRKGMKWSDGAPLTSADFTYWFDNVVKNPTLTKTSPLWLTSLVDGKRELCELTAPDAYTVKFKFPKASALLYLNGSIVYGAPCPPAHYMKQWHGDLTTDKAALEKAMAAGNFKTWDALYGEKNTLRLNPERPSFEPWIHENAWGSELVTLRRNPYFWAVDKEGNQLPYISKLSFRLFQDPEVYALWYANGEIDCQARHLAFNRYTVLKENEKKGDYALQVWKQTAVFMIHLNMNAKNPKLRELFMERDFRIAVSLGIDRNALNQQIYEGLATPMQYGPPEGSPQYYEKLNKAYVQYDLKKANEMLDALGYSKKDADGYRLWKDGSGRVGWTLLGEAKPTDDTLAVIDNFKKMGLEVVYKGLDRSIRITMSAANDIECALTNGDRTLVPLADPQIWIGPTSERPWCQAWSLWRADPKNPNGEEPPQGHWIRTIWSTWDQIEQSADDKQRNELFKKILDIWATEMPSPAFLGNLPRLLPVKNGLKGPTTGNYWDCCSSSYEHIVDNTAWYWDQPEKHT
jgi:peptide/nickel transport system substrate-binding protein